MSGLTGALLRALGYRRPSYGRMALRALAPFAAGLAVGVCAPLVYAPKRSREALQTFRRWVMRTDSEPMKETHAAKGATDGAAKNQGANPSAARA